MHWFSSKFDMNFRQDYTASDIKFSSNPELYKSVREETVCRNLTL